MKVQDGSPAKAVGRLYEARIRIKEQRWYLVQMGGNTQMAEMPAEMEWLKSCSIFV